MKKKQKIIIRSAALVLLVGIVVVLIISSDRIGGKNTPTPAISNTPTPEVTLAPDDTPTPTLTSRPTNTPTPTEPVLPYTDIEGINYNNYAGEMASVILDEGSLSFGDYGYYTYHDIYGAAHTYRISDWISLDDEVSTADGNWFFGGALQTPNYTYVEYDYWGKSKHTLYIRISRTGRNGTFVTSLPYNENNNFRNLTASNEYTFYVSSDGNKYSIMQADTDGKNPEPIGTFEEGERPFGLWCLESELVFFTEKGKKIALKTIDLHEHTIKEIAAECKVSEYLYVFGRFALTGVSDNALMCYNLDTGKQTGISLWNKKVSGIYYGEPLCTPDCVCLQYFDWSGKSGTDIIPVDPETGKAGNPVSLSEEMTYLCGVTDGAFYAEKNAEYVQYLIPEF